MDRLTDLALALPPALRELVAYRIWESLHPEESWPLASGQIEEIRRRAAEVEAGTVQLVDGEDVLRNARARIDARRQ
ncbi:addiction module protein [Sorangium sp. So ce1014]|uniref:addiction module protein n=1 Tax=Sorangium sp. So ce1014 TaxID=3133326 RepID=UPI003F64235A